MATTVNATLKHKRGTEASMPILKDGQIYLCSDTHKMYKGTSTGENILISDIAQLNDNTQNLTNHQNSIVTSSEGIHGLKIEYGTFTPYILNGEYVYEMQEGTFQRINSIIHFQLEMKISSITTLSSGVLLVSGLPYTANSTRYSITVGQIEYITFTGQINARLVNGNTINFENIQSNSVSEKLNYTSLNANSHIVLSGTYKMA